jgi:hypothetical protein
VDLLSERLDGGGPVVAANEDDGDEERRLGRFDTVRTGMEILGQVMRAAKRTGMWLGGGEGSVACCSGSSRGTGTAAVSGS